MSGLNTKAKSILRAEAYAKYFQLLNRILEKHQVLLRKTEYLVNGEKHRYLYLLYKMRLIRMQNKYTLHIPVNICGKGLKIIHIGSILINGKAYVGKDCLPHINTALVTGGTNDDVPYLEDGIVAGVGAVI